MGTPPVRKLIRNHHMSCRERLTYMYSNAHRGDKMEDGECALAVGSRVERKITKEGDKSISWSPRVMRTLPPVLRTSLLSTGFRMGS